jgi:hypothetical protein
MLSMLEGLPDTATSKWLLPTSALPLLSGSLAITLAALTLAATATVQVAGALTATLEPVAFTAATTVLWQTTGALAVTLSPIVFVGAAVNGESSDGHFATTLRAATAWRTSVAAGSFWTTTTAPLTTFKTRVT